MDQESYSNISNYGVVIKSEPVDETETCNIVVKSDPCAVILDYQSVSWNEIHPKLEIHTEEDQQLPSFHFEHNYCKRSNEDSSQVRFKIKEGVAEETTSCLLVKDNEPNNENVLRIAPENNSFECEICSKVLPTRKGLKMHHYIHNVTKPDINISSQASQFNKNVCITCGKTFKYLSSLKFHERAHKKRNKSQNKPKKVPLRCVFCQKNYKSLATLKIHLRTHTGEKPYSCENCPARFTCLLYLKVHQVTHSKIKAYKCEKCEKSFTQKSSLNTHAVAHTGVKKFVCGICGKCFAIKSYLKYHEVVHTPKIKAFKCQICEKSFSRKSSLNTHVANHKWSV